MEKVIAFLVPIFGIIVQSLSPEFRALIEKFVRELNVKAQATKSPWDDVLVKLLAAVLGITL